MFSYICLSTFISMIGNMVVANMHMFITDQRLLLVEPNLGIRRIFTGRPFQELMVVRDKQFMTLKASGYANSDKHGHHLKIRGLAAAEEAEKFIQYYFMETLETPHE
ncbi:MAG: hypothetical protein EX271_13690 [Acidimicrobiales bacterium]|nr:MAG: hypothetical protein EX271_13690 [Acidimicrobiales bacterium]